MTNLELVSPPSEHRSFAHKKKKLHRRMLALIVEGERVAFIVEERKGSPPVINLPGGYQPQARKKKGKLEQMVHDTTGISITMGDQVGSYRISNRIHATFLCRRRIAQLSEKLPAMIWVPLNHFDDLPPHPTHTTVNGKIYAVAALPIRILQNYNANRQVVKLAV